MMTFVRRNPNEVQVRARVIVLVAVRAHQRQQIPIANLLAELLGKAAEVQIAAAEMVKQGKRFIFNSNEEGFRSFVEMDRSLCHMFSRPFQPIVERVAVHSQPVSRRRMTSQMSLLPFINRQHSPT